eukprot:CAMPEP_0113465550 /NCGR_PEP_ID=MMETSP0014_2-20120614/13799_1 /TAXON_ID=2857 /ORGANISM="Nitzschia sp." /LENGTH=64 /DNA_ID=CAMNT_0000357715 /DNA_START=808 /DNA_END=1002 /DNA_ORIENTATION=+ /assembly_acc=CAM_ASM_000159
MKSGADVVSGVENNDETAVDLLFLMGPSPPRPMRMWSMKARLEAHHSNPRDGMEQASTEDGVDD